MEEIMVSTKRPKKMPAGLFVAFAVALCAPILFAGEPPAEAPAAQAASGTAPTLDYEFFKTRVEPIFLKIRSEDHVRCYACHQVTRHPANFHLEVLPKGQKFWTEEQSRTNFATLSKLVVPGSPLSSLLCLMPLDPQAGGLADTHQGGRQFASQDDPDWKNIKAWVLGEKAKP